MRTASIISLLAGAIIAAIPASAAAQAPATPARTWEFNLTSGALVPTGALRETVKNASVSAAQLSYVIVPSVAVTSTFGWGRSRDLSTVNDPKLDVFTYDIGLEGRAPRIGEKAIGFSPFVGLGAGGRSYNYRSLAIDATHNLAAYAAMGGEIAVPHVRLRLEVRDNVAGFKPLSGSGRSETANDLVAMLGVRFSKH
jgi:hypothetical protein